MPCFLKLTLKRLKSLSFGCLDWHMNHPLEDFIDNLTDGDSGCLRCVVVDWRKLNNVRPDDFQARI